MTEEEPDLLRKWQNQIKIQNYQHFLPSQP